MHRLAGWGLLVGGLLKRLVPMKALPPRPLDGDSAMTAATGGPPPGALQMEEQSAPAEMTDAW